MTNLDISVAETVDCSEFEFTDFLLLLYSSPCCCTTRFSYSTDPLNTRLLTLVYFVFVPVVLHISKCPTLSLIVKNDPCLSQLPTAPSITEMFFFLMYMGQCILIIFQYRSLNKMHKSQSLFYLTTALHVSGVTITHLQKHKTTVNYSIW
jgi:hypothetical protein